MFLTFWLWLSAGTINHSNALRAQWYSRHEVYCLNFKTATNWDNAISGAELKNTIIHVFICPRTSVPRSNGSATCMILRFRCGPRALFPGNLQRRGSHLNIITTSSLVYAQACRLRCTRVYTNIIYFRYTAAPTLEFHPPPTPSQHKDARASAFRRCDATPRNCKTFVLRAVPSPTMSSSSSSVATNNAIVHDGDVRRREATIVLPESDVRPRR